MGRYCSMLSQVSQISSNLVKDRQISIELFVDLLQRFILIMGEILVKYYVDWYIKIFL